MFLVWNDIIIPALFFFFIYLILSINWKMWEEHMDVHQSLFSQCKLLRDLYALINYTYYCHLILTWSLHVILECYWHKNLTQLTLTGLAKILFINVKLPFVYSVCDSTLTFLRSRRQYYHFQCWYFILLWHFISAAIFYNSYTKGANHLS